MAGGSAGPRASLLPRTSSLGRAQRLVGGGHPPARRRFVRCLGGGSRPVKRVGLGGSKSQLGEYSRRCLNNSHLGRWLCWTASISTPSTSRTSPTTLPRQSNAVRLPTLHHTPYTLTPFTLHPTPYTLHPTPCTLQPTPYTLHPTPYTLNPSSSAQDPKSSTLHSKPSI